MVNLKRKILIPITTIILVIVSFICYEIFKPNLIVPIENKEIEYLSIYRLGMRPEYPQKKDITDTEDINYIIDTINYSITDRRAQEIDFAEGGYTIAINIHLKDGDSYIVKLYVHSKTSGIIIYNKKSYIASKTSIPSLWSELDYEIIPLKSEDIPPELYLVVSDGSVS